MFFAKKDGCHEYCCSTIHRLGDSHSTVVGDVVLENPETEIGSLQRSALEKSFGRSESKISISEIGEKPSSATIHQLGFIEESKGNFDEATILYQESLTISIENGNRHTQATTMSQLAYLEIKHNRNLDEAERLYQKVLDLELELGRTKNAENARKNLDYVRLFLDNLDDPEQLKKKILALQGEDVMFDEEEQFLISKLVYDLLIYTPD